MKKVYTTLGISLGAFLGGPLAGAYFMSKNYECLGQKELAQKVIRIGVIITLVFLTILIVLPEKINDSIPNYLFPVIFVGVARYLTDKYQKQSLEEFIDNGGEYESNWKAAGISLLIAIITTIAALAIAILLDLFLPV